ncbi:hypothetical protein KUTeg_024705 [Tegillarca granosa]|uniref:Ig-like domain-containing protein n=1 Tax=Tegillarca granosa TaxID=220873 RepID=A0ABQ9DY17_TEGGR|nr:hypothetical protein KUTeg_024705 [Tegillarca granosa]
MITDAAWTLTGSSEFAVAGESFTLKCNPQDSNAVAVLWKRLDIDTTATGTNRAIVTSNGCRIGSGYDTQYQYTCEPGPLYKLTIPAHVMTNSQNNKVWRCESAYGGAAAEYTVKVHVPVSSISIQADNAVNQNVNVIYENIPKTFYCITNGCRPKANVTATTTGVTKGQLTESTTQNGDLIITRVSQVITANRGGSTTKTLQCSAVNIQGRQPIASQLILPSIKQDLVQNSDGSAQIKLQMDSVSDNNYTGNETGNSSVSKDQFSVTKRESGNKEENNSYQDVDIQMYEELDATNKNNSQYDTLQEQRITCDTQQQSVR